MKTLLKSVAKTTQSLPVAQVLTTAHPDIWTQVLNQNYMSFDIWTQTVKSLRDNPKVEVLLRKGSSHDFDSFTVMGELHIRPKLISRLFSPIRTPLSKEEYKRLHDVLHPTPTLTLFQKLKALL